MHSRYGPRVNVQDRATSSRHGPLADYSRENRHVMRHRESGLILGPDRSCPDRGLLETYYATLAERRAIGRQQSVMPWNKERARRRSRAEEIDRGGWMSPVCSARSDCTPFSCLRSSPAAFAPVCPAICEPLMPLFRSPPLAKKLFVPLSKRTLTSRWTTIGVSVDNARSFDAFEHNSAFTACYRGWPPSSTYNARSGWRRVPDWKPTERGERKTVDRWRRSDSLWLSYVSLSLSLIHTRTLSLFLPLNRYPRLDFQERSTLAKPQRALRENQLDNVINPTLQEDSRHVFRSRKERKKIMHLAHCSPLHTAC